MSMAQPLITIKTFQEICNQASVPGTEQTSTVDRILQAAFKLSDTSMLSGIEESTKAVLAETSLIGDPTTKPLIKLQVDGRAYKVVYDIKTLSHLQSRLLLTYLTDPIANLHLLLACLLHPVESGWKHWKTGFIKTARLNQNGTELLAEKLLELPVQSALLICRFYCSLFIAILRECRPVMLSQLISKGSTEETARAILAKNESLLTQLFHQN